MRELLKEAAEILGDCYYNGKEPLSDGTRAKIAKTIKRIEAALAEPEPVNERLCEKCISWINGECHLIGKCRNPWKHCLGREFFEKHIAANSAPEPDVMELVDKLEKLLNMDQAVFPPPSSYSEAAALIADYGRRVPRAMLEEILDKAWNCLTDRPEGMVLQTIAAKHGVKVEDAK